VYDILKIEGGLIHPGDGGPHFQAEFRLVVFKPFVGEVMTARLTRSSLEGLYLSTGFFDDILIQDGNLQEPAQ
jgi:DNA-directed RNA polymerase III subunit RPC8